ncbi:Uncharacterised protein [Serratia fonticola]|uniref:Peptidase M60 domain-containing protein n=1 Tax=Serratia fonticola TaxID=47917 RepID=A0A4U9UMI8_SERFO|nr:Uncharacterised protein [Serratia fonticola]
MKNPIHCPDVNPYHYVPSEKGYMTTFQNRITYHTDLTKRMIIPSEVRSFWGIWHEMGHNLQTTGLNWPGQVEVAVNIYAFAERAYTKTLGSLVTSYDPDFKTTYNALKNVDTYPQLPDADRERLFHHLFFIFGETFMHMLHRRYREKYDRRTL